MPSAPSIEESYQVRQGVRGTNGKKTQLPRVSRILLCVGQTITKQQLSNTLLEILDKCFISAGETDSNASAASLMVDRCGPGPIEDTLDFFRSNFLSIHRFSVIF